MCFGESGGSGEKGGLLDVLISQLARKGAPPALAVAEVNPQKAEQSVST